MAAGLKNKAMEILKLFKKIIGSKISVSAKLDKATALLADEFDVDASACYLVLDDNYLELFSAYGFNTKITNNLTLRVGEGIIGGIAMSKRTTAVENIWQNPDFLYRAEAGEDKYKSFLGTPIIRWVRSIGVLCLYKKDLYTFVKTDVEALETLAMAFAEWVASDEVREYKNTFMKKRGQAIKDSYKGLSLSRGFGIGSAVVHRRRQPVTKIFADDKTGKEVMDILCKKAREGLDVKLIYDSIGSRKAPRRFFRKLEKAGGQVGEFFPPFMHIRLINLKLNYRNHRKLAIIDGMIGYTGGVNIRDDHLGKNKKLSPWRDTHIRIEGGGCYALQNIFLDDWRYCKNDNTPPKLYLENGLFPSPKIFGNATIQVVNSGPDSQIQKIKETFVQMITNAKERVYIQTPYFIPDDVFTSALRIAASSGVDVRIMVPFIPDKKTVYLATLSYLKEMAEMGIKIYLYNGFLHSKAILIDSNKLSIGTCNTDNRSFGLNFEDTVIIYSNELNKEYSKIFEKDISKSKEVGINYFQKKRWITKLLQAIMRLLSSLF